MLAKQRVSLILVSAHNVWAAFSLPGVSSCVASAGFPTSAFASYYFLSASPSQNPQPAIYDPVLNITYPVNLTNRIRFWMLIPT
jgi:hypothetical protein